MSLASSPNFAPRPEKQPTNIYTMMLVISLVAIITGTTLLAMELNRFGEFPWWQLPPGTSMPAGV
jgi:hypothetical protein